MKKAGLALLLLAIGSGAFAEGAEPQRSLRYSCLISKRFLNVTASTPERNSFPDVRLKLTDPKRRQSGFAVRRNRIPSSRYAKIVELPKMPHRSRAIAVEVCAPEEGIYEITIEEQMPAQYRLTITGEGGAATHSEPMHLVSHPGGKRHYSFRYTVVAGNAEIKLLNEGGQPLTVVQRDALFEWHPPR